MSATSAPAPVECGSSEKVNREEQSHGISILKEIFPEHGSAQEKAPILEQLLGNIATPARTVQGMSPKYTAKPLRPTVPPPPALPPSMPAQPRQGHWQASALAPITPPGPMFGSYRERLRAGGRNAFQRSMDAGLMPKAMKQEWNPASATAAASPFFPHQTYSGMEDMQQMWNAGTAQPQANGCWEFSSDQSQMPMQMPFPEDVPLMQQPQASQSGPMQMMPMMQQPIPQVSSMWPDQCLQMQLPQMDLAQSPMAQMQMPLSSESTPTAIDRCMSIVMPQSAQFPCDSDSVAAQLKAVAADQCYED